MPMRDSNAEDRRGFEHLQELSQTRQADSTENAQHAQLVPPVSPDGCLVLENRGHGVEGRMDVKSMMNQPVR